MTSNSSNDQAMFYTPESLTRALEGESAAQATGPESDPILSNPPFGARSGAASKADQAT